MILFLLALTAVYAITVYNKLQTLKVRIGASIQEIGNQLKRQMALIPNLVESTKGYLKHERDIFDKLAAARAAIGEAVKSAKPDKILASQRFIQKALGSLRVIVESNPQIKASTVVTRLMGELHDTADKIMYARRTLIDLTADYNKMIVTIPSSLIAKLAGFQPKEGLQTKTEGPHLAVSKEETKTPTVKLN